MTTEAEATEVETIETEAGDTSQTTDQVEQTADVEEIEGQEASDQTETEGDDLEEVEWDGIKARVPPAIKAGLMRTADYTRKTQEVAEERKALDARSQTIAQQAETVEALAEDYGKVHALKAQVKAFEGIDWRNLNAEALAAEDPQAAQIEINSLWMQYQQLKVDAETADKELSGKVSERRLQSEREAATAMQETSRQLADPKTGIKGWSPEKATALVDLAKTRGVTMDELKHADARTWHLLNDLHEARSQLTKQKAATNHASAQQTTPAKAVTGKTTPAAGLDDRLSTKNWMERRNAELAAKRRA